MGEEERTNMPRNQYSNIIYSSAETTTVRLGKIRGSRFCFGWLLAARPSATRHSRQWRYFLHCGSYIRNMADIIQSIRIHSHSTHALSFCNLSFFEGIVCVLYGFALFLSILIRNGSVQWILLRITIVIPRKNG